MNTSYLHSEAYNYTLNEYPNKTVEICYNKPVFHVEAVWNENSMQTNLPTFTLQFAVILTINRIFLVLSESINVPRIVANIFTGFILGPSALGRWDDFFKKVFPYDNMLPLETVGAVVLVYYTFLVGLEVDLKPLTKFYNKKAIIVAISGIVFTFPIGFGLYYLLVTDMGLKSLSPANKDKHMRGAIFWGITLSCSSEFPELAKILSDLKLLLTENGQLALTSSIITDFFSWILLLLALTQLHYASYSSLFIAIIFVVLCFYVVHPFVKWLIKAIGTGDREFLDSQVLFLLNIVMLIGSLFDGFGATSIVGAFFLGVIIPKGSLNNAVQDKVFDFVSVFMMPLFFLIVGERTMIQEMVFDTRWITVVIVVVLAFLAKIVAMFLASWFYQMPVMEGFSLALLMNTKGTLPVIILYTARDRLELDGQCFAVMLFACWLMTASAGPMLIAVTKRIAMSKILNSQRSTAIHGTWPNSLLRVLACVHSKRDANAIINLLKASSPSVKTPIQVLAVELIKMTNRPSSSLIIRDARQPSFRSNSSKVESYKRGNGGDNLESFNNLSQAIFADKLRVVSHYNSMHKDILNLCTQRNVNLILTSLYKQPTYDSSGSGTATARAVNIINRDHASKDEKKIVLENLVKETPCSLAIFVDREFGQKRSKENKIAMLYVGGEDDREALSYAWRMSRNMEVELTVMRLVWDSVDDEFDEVDKVYLKGFVQQTMNVTSVRYLEKVVKDEKQTVRLLNRIGSKGFDLIVIGRGHGRKMSLAQTLDPVLDEPALGPLGDALADLSSAVKTSILIFQRGISHCGGGGNGEYTGKHGRNASSSIQYLDTILEQQSMCPSSGFHPMMFSHYA